MRAWAYAGLSLALIAFHLGTLGISSSYSFLFDDAAQADYAYHDELSLWRGIIPPGQRNLLNTYGWSLWNGAMKTQGWILHHAGVGVRQSRLGSAAAGLLGLFLVVLMIRTLELPWFYSVGLLLFGFTRPFFNVTHSGRPEAFVFLAMAFNWLWFFRWDGRFWSVLAGFAASGAFAFHEAAVFILVPMPAMLFWRHGGKILKSGRSCWWAIGAAAGAICAMDAIDIDRGTQFLQFWKGLQVPPLLRLWREPIDIAGQSARFLYLTSKQGYAWHMLLSCLLLLTALLIRQRGRLTSKQRELLGICVLTELSFFLLTASYFSSYYIYLAPGLLLCGLTGIELLLRGELKLGLADKLILAAAHIAVFYAILARFAFLSVISASLGVLLQLKLRPKPLRITLAAAACAALAAVLSESVSFELVGRLNYLARYRPSVLLMLGAAPLLLLLPDEVRPPWRALKPIRFGRIFIAYCAACYLAVVAGHLQWLRGQTDISRLSEEQAQKLRSLKGQDRLLAPAELWFYEPAIPFQSTDALIRNQHDLDIAKAIVDYDPTFILWPAAELPLLEKSFRSSRRGRGRLEWGASWPMPTGVWREVRIIE